jgi:hypothetical protein
MAETDKVLPLQRISEFPLVWLRHFLLAAQHPGPRLEGIALATLRRGLVGPRIKVPSQLTSTL